MNENEQEVRGVNKVMIYGNNTAIRLECEISTLVFVNTATFDVNTSIVGVLNALSAPPTIILNALILAAMYHKTSLRKTSNTVLGSLAVSDLLSGLLVQPSIATILFISNVWLPVDIPCELIAFASVTGYTLACISLLTVSLVSFERYMAIFHPFIHSRYVSARALFTACLCIWIISFAAIFSMYFTSRQHAVFFIVNSIVIAFTYIWNIYVYIKIMVQVKQIHGEHAQRVKSLHMNSIVDNHKPSTQSHDILNRKRCSKGMRLAAMVIMVLLLCYFPQIVLSVWRIIPNYPLFVDGHLEYWSMTIGPLAACVNPWIYCYYNSEFKKEVLDIACKFNLCCSSNRRSNTWSRNNVGIDNNNSSLNDISSRKNCTFKESAVQINETII